MSTSLHGVTVAGIIRPGESYLLFESTCGFMDSEIDLIYLVKSEEELMQTLRTEMDIVLKSMYGNGIFVGVKKLTDDRYEFAFTCHDREDDRDIEHRLWLQRLKSCSEMEQAMRRIFCESI